MAGSDKHMKRSICLQFYGSFHHSRLLLVLLLVQVLPSETFLFTPPPLTTLLGASDTFDHRNKNNCKGRDSREKFTTACQASSSSLSMDDIVNSASPNSAFTAKQQQGDDDVKNIFYKYDKPVVLVGFSSPQGDELMRLARHLCGVNIKSDTSDHDGIIYQAHEQDQNMNELLLQAKDTHSSKGTKLLPRVVVADYSKLILSDSDTTTTDQLTSLVQSFYEQANLLCVYINVDATVSSSSSSSSSSTDETTLQSTKRQQLEQDSILSYTDYELCIRDEGVKTAAAAAAAATNDKDSDDDGWEHITWELDRLLGRARLISALPGDTYTRTTNSAHLTMGKHTFFASLSTPKLTDVIPFVDDLCADVDALEIRTDLLQDDIRNDRFSFLYQMQLLRKACRPHAKRVPALPTGTVASVNSDNVGSSGRQVLEDVMPFVYTVRTRNQAGTFPDDTEGIKQMFKMLKWGLRAGVEVLDVECDWDKDLTRQLLDRAEERYSSQVLGSHHIVGRTVDTEEAVRWFEKCALSGRAHGAKVVLTIDDEDQDRMAYEASLIASELARQEGRPVIPNISLILGDVGKFSRIINLPFTPVTHEKLPVKAAPGQLTANEIMTTRLLTNIFERKNYAIIGHNIAYSVSPQMHGTAFATTKLPHQYARADVATVEEFLESDFYKSSDFGGTSVTIPHKEAIIPYVDVLSDSAKTIGSVNTLVVKEEYIDDQFKRVVYGDNTDWRGIYNPLNRLLGSSVDSDSDYVLIVGAGGTARAAAYVASKLGLNIVFYNRTPSKAQKLVDEFGGKVVTSLEQSSEAGSLATALNDNQARLRVVISTLPAAANFELPSWILDDKMKPIIFDVNYKPYTTALLAQAEKSNCSVVRGSEMLWEQGVGQFELWTERTAPYGVMKQVVLENCITT